VTSSWSFILQLTVGFSFMTTLQHLGNFFLGFLSKEQCDKTWASPVLPWPG